MSLLRLSDGHVAMHSPLAPTQECVAMVSRCRPYDETDDDVMLTCCQLRIVTGKGCAQKGRLEGPILVSCS